MGEAWGLRRALAAALLCLAAALLVPAAASAAGETFHTTPGAQPNATCDQADPCELASAVEKAGDGDSISVGAGIYQPGDLPLTPLQVTEAIDIGGAPGARPLFLTAELQFLQITRDAGPGARIHDLAFEGGGPLLIESGTVERVFVSYSSDEPVVAEPPAACIVKLDTTGAAATLRDSVCWSNEANGPSTAAGLRISVGDQGPDKIVQLRNVTAVAAGRGGDGLEAFAGGNAQVLVDAKNVIARAANGVDVVASAAEPKVLPRVLVRMAGSNYASVAETNVEIDVTDPGSEGNSTAAPLFVDAASGNFRPAAGSPTLDAGVEDPLNGGIDIDGAGRAQPSCLGPYARPLPDAGAYERSPEGQCPTPPQPPPPPPEPAKPQFRILKLKLNKRSGKGSVQVEVPAAGIAGLTGSGVKFVTRKTASAGIVRLPIQPWAITTVRLNKFGKTRVRLKVTFEPTAGGPPGLRSMNVLLKRNRRPR